MKQTTFSKCDPKADLDLGGQANTDSEMETKPNILVMLIFQSMWPNKLAIFLLYKTSSVDPYPHWEC